MPSSEPNLIRYILRSKKREETIRKILSELFIVQFELDEDKVDTYYIDEAIASLAKFSRNYFPHKVIKYKRRETNESIN